MIQVVATLVTKPGLRTEVLNVFQETAPAVRAESGCIEYAAFVDLAGGFGAAQTLYGDDTFVVIEKWSDADALRAHARAPHMVGLVAKLKGRIASQTIRILTAV
jgi:quinol monooxygenase YgiN